MASVKELKLVPPVGRVLLMVKIPEPTGVVLLAVREILSIIVGGLLPPLPSFFQVKMRRMVDGAEQDPKAEEGMFAVKLPATLVFHRRAISMVGAGKPLVPKLIVLAVGV
jgi:hypothetical protein